MKIGAEATDIFDSDRYAKASPECNLYRLAPLQPLVRTHANTLLQSIESMEREATRGKGAIIRVVPSSQVLNLCFHWLEEDEETGSDCIYEKPCATGHS